MYYDVVIVGGGHAGIEASLAASRMGCRALLITPDIGAIGRMSCNPAIGGTAKGHLVREVDALGGEMGKIADATGIHFRMLNRSKGPAVWSPRCQNDREWYGKEAKRRVLNQKGLEVRKDILMDLIVEDGRMVGLETEKGNMVSCRSLVLCSGTFLNAIMHTGTSAMPGGRFGEPASIGLSEKLTDLGFQRGRLKTGTPPRLNRNTIDFGAIEEQMGDKDPIPFSYETKRITNRQIPMYLTYTNDKTHEILKTGFDRSPMFTGRITGIGPRYCPSIEDKLNRFADRVRHQLFLEPEGYASDIVYLNGFSTSLPEEVQRKALTTIRGLEKSEMVRAGYAVEYDYFPPHQVTHSLETKLIKGLFFAGQINGTSGYEEAAAQGIVAGINAALNVKELPPFTLQRSEAYIGVLIDDLINKSTDEPYRIFTSRAEHRLFLRQDNADSRLMRKGHAVGLISTSAIDRLNEKERRIAEAKQFMAAERIVPAELNASMGARLSEQLRQSETFTQVLKRSDVQLTDLLQLPDALADQRMRVLFSDREALERVEVEVKYQGYLKRQDEQIRQFERSESTPIPEDFDFARLKSLSNEAREKLQKVRPRSLGQASRISGVTPADISVLMISIVR